MGCGGEGGDGVESVVELLGVGDSDGQGAGGGEEEGVGMLGEVEGK